MVFGLEYATGIAGSVRFIDSHTAGEPTRVILEDGPELGDGTLKERAERLEYEHKDFCSSVLLEPRGHDAMVGALIVPTLDPECVCGVIYFNPMGNLGMCGHATIGLAATLFHLGRIGLGVHFIETPVGRVKIDLKTPNTISVLNVESYRAAKDVSVEVQGFGTVTGDVAWGGNWFFLTKSFVIPLKFENIPELTSFSSLIRDALKMNKVTGTDGAEIDHVELMGPAHLANTNGRSFVLCPGLAYDRSPCGTGCSAKLACLASDRELAAGEMWIQESIISSTYALSYQSGENGGVICTIEGQAFITNEGRLFFDPVDPYKNGIQPD